MFNRCFNRNAIHIGSKRIGDGELQFNLADYNLDRVFPDPMLNSLLGAPIDVVAHGPDDAAHNVQMGVVMVEGRGRELQISQMNGMMQAYNWNANTSISAYYYSSGVRRGGRTHKLVIFQQVGGSCKGCGFNV